MKTIYLNFPSQFSKFISNAEQISFEGSTLSELLEKLEQDYGNIKERLYENESELRSYLQFFIGSDNIKNLDGPDTLLKDNDKITLLISRAGG